MEITGKVGKTSVTRCTRLWRNCDYFVYYSFTGRYGPTCAARYCLKSVSVCPSLLHLRTSVCLAEYLCSDFLTESNKGEHTFLRNVIRYVLILNGCVEIQNPY